MVLSAEQAELNSLIQEHLALSSALSVPEPTKTSSAGIVWPPKLESSKPSLALATKPMKARLVTLNGSKLHLYPRKDAPYPLSYNQAVLDSDICDRITLRKLCRNGLTMHDFGSNPPDSVLDIGTGEGSWIIEAARVWQNASLLVGFDLVEIQPVLSQNGPLASLHERIRWIQGNALERLPFDSQTFDLVRICRIALGVPETKWDSLIEEAVRVLKPGGVFEIIEEDIIFPSKRGSCNFIPESFDLSGFSNATSVSLQGDHDSPGSSAADHTYTAPPRRPLSVVVSKSLATRTRSRSLGSQSSSISSAPSAFKSGVSNTPVSAMPHVNYLPALSITNSEKPGVPLRNPQDHSILNQAWHAMLDERFIGAKPTSFLPLYLSFHLQSIRTHEPIQVLAPPSSFVSEQQRHVPSYAEKEPYEVYLTPMDAPPSAHPRNSGIFTVKDAAMHLRRSLQVVLGCTEALWEQVKKAHPAMSRDYFDYILRDFELDMLDRIDTRGALKSNIGWGDAGFGSSDLLKWRDRVLAWPHEEVESPLVCRTIRGFVGIKGSG